MASVLPFSQVSYPESDGKPMGETDDHRDEMFRHIELLKHYFEGQKVYVSGNLLVYYEQGNPKKFVVPDAFVVKEITPKKRRIYKIWTEGRVPDVIIETTSRKTRRNDTVDKAELYSRLGVKEYFLFDCLEEYLDPPLQGYRLVGSMFQPMVLDESDALVSHELGLTLRRGEGCLQFYRLDNGQRLLTASERAQQADQRAQQEADARLAEANARRAEAEARRAEADARRIEAEARRAAEEEVARLREELKRRS